MTDNYKASKIDLTDPASFVFWTRDNVRFSDIDRYRHINNVAMATYCESGRVEFAEKLMPGSTSGEGAGWVILRLTISYLAQAHYPGYVDIGTRVDRIGSSSCTICQGLFKDEVCFATSEAVLVWLDLEGGGRPTPIPDELRHRMMTQAAVPHWSAPVPVTAE